MIHPRSVLWLAPSPQAWQAEAAEGTQAPLALPAPWLVLPASASWPPQWAAVAAEVGGTQGRQAPLVRHSLRRTIGRRPFRGDAEWAGQHQARRHQRNNRFWRDRATVAAKRPGSPNGDPKQDGSNRRAQRGVQHRFCCEAAAGQQAGRRMYEEVQNGVRTRVRLEQIIARGGLPNEASDGPAREETQDSAGSPLFRTPIQERDHQHDQSHEAEKEHSHDFALDSEHVTR